MQQKTSSALFEKYGTVYEYPLELENTDRISTDWHIIAKRNISSVYCFDRSINASSYPQIVDKGIHRKGRKPKDGLD